MGTEEHGEPAEVEEAFVTHGDPGPRMNLWSKNDPVTLFGAIGMSQSGWDKLRETFTWVASRFSDVSGFHFDVEVLGVDRDGLHPGLRAVRRIDRRAPGGARVGSRDPHLPS